ncbi:hypothetical protein [Sporomusa sp.]|uniref:hypothetical protein n=1 Tax=Sporomusa sp. TaxID=2078658 RepID=UPI002C549710|nr:hypothetical protein [Sporomusa sp.]HWR43045.1 hypothetical protein [Sporomusa sp.]
MIAKSHMLSDDIHQAIQRYAEMVLQEPKDSADIMKLWAHESIEPIIVDEPTHIVCVNETDLLAEKQTLEEIANYTAEEMQVPLGQLLGDCRIRKVVEARNILIYRAVESQVCTKAELAKKLGIDPAAITRGYQRVKASTAT